MKERSGGLRGPLAALAPGFGEELARLGYAKGPTRAHLGLLAELSGWLDDGAHDPAELTAGRAGEFLAERRLKGRTRLVTPVGLATLLGYLHRLGVVPPPSRPAPVGFIDELIERYRVHLVARRGLVEAVVAQYESAARLFIAATAAREQCHLAALTTADVTGFLTRECARRGNASARALASALRSFLRFIHLEGITVALLAQAVPSVAFWSASSLPRALGPGEAARLLASCDRRTGVGRRDFAILTLLVRLGLRAGEVAALKLEDIDWRGGEVVIHGKGPREERLPLPVDVGEALAGYLRRGRPESHVRAVFLRLPAPRRGLTPVAVTGVVYSACNRANLPRVGAHRLRHTAATEMLRSGASLEEVGQVLRHRAAGTTAIYAKVDHAALATLARPWPGGRT